MFAPAVTRFRLRSSKIRSEYFRSEPSAQNALDIFEGEWYTSLPGALATLRSGAHEFYADPRLAWGISELGGLSGNEVLELGPLEGAHTYLLERAGCSRITSIEANPRAYLKCLVLKEILNLERSRFLCGDFVEYLRVPAVRVDAVIASGVLYHMTNPAELIFLIGQVTDRVFLWTHYYDEAALLKNSKVRARFTNRLDMKYEGFRFPAFRYEYWGSSGLVRFCGGPRPYALWMNRESILECLKWFGFRSILINFDAPDHEDGPACAIVARRL